MQRQVAEPPPVADKPLLQHVRKQQHRKGKRSRVAELQIQIVVQQLKVADHQIRLLQELQRLQELRLLQRELQILQGVNNRTLTPTEVLSRAAQQVA